MNKISPKQRAKNEELNKLNPDLCQRCNGYWNGSVIIGYSEKSHRWGVLHRHHIIKRSLGGQNTLDNILCLDFIDHTRADHPNSEMKINGVPYPPFTLEEQKELARRLNEKVSDNIW